jgi:Ca2+-binding EF-hand superfamily protein
MIVANKVGEVLALVAKDIKSGLVPSFDKSKNHDIKVVSKEDAFEHMDRNHDGKITREEFKN